MISVSEIVQSFWQIVGWPYKSPGTNNENGIDCSGAFVRAYEQYGYSIYHGTNRIIRVYCHDVFSIQNEGQLKPGMPVFKSKTDLSDLKAEYKPGGRYYDPSLPYDYYHIGLVVSVNPLKIIHATTPSARVDMALGNFTYAGYLNAVDYAETPVQTGDAKVIAPSGSTVNLRNSPSKSATVLYRVPIGSEVTVLSQEADGLWSRIQYTITGFMMSEFLEIIAAGARFAPGPVVARDCTPCCWCQEEPSCCEPEPPDEKMLIEGLQSEINVLQEQADGKV